MAPSRKSRQEKTCALPKRKTPIGRTLPGDILLEIAARIDLRTLIRCAATCKRFRRDILSPHFLRHVSQAAPSILAYLCTDTKKHVTLVHPTTPAALSLCHNHLSRFLSRKADVTHLGKYYKPMSSRHGLVLLHHVDIKNRPMSDRYNMCVYNPMSGVQKFFSSPPEIGTNKNRDHQYLLLTTADGIDYSFMLLVFETYGWGIKVHTASSCSTWELLTYEGKNDFHVWPLNHRGNPAILHGGVIHWLSGNLAKNILRYDFGA
ncbi:hypothetical protein QYE76_057958 [Lolium multiflorum]|uniref:F-box domain-containing protein n=1 Tax=Lolium multiflorum TaxID=4521 RepID=A0AAD8T588_LOLMU|nr:hypothetical protein QYE76_057958 [Lolium multiflorum]